MASQTVTDISQSWLSAYSSAIYAADASAVADLFLPHGWLRDVLTFTWDLRSLEGREKIIHHLSASQALKKARVSDIKLDERNFLQPEEIILPRGERSIEGSFTFETGTGHGQGKMRLLEDEKGDWKALYVSMILYDLRGYEEAGFESGIYGGHTLAWGDVFSERKRSVEKDPQVLIIGAAQSGLQAAARLKQMGIRSLLIEKNDRIGDNWRQRYPTVTLHTSKFHHELLYQPFPDNWPFFTPRDKLADWMEAYAIAQDLVFWTRSQIKGRPTYDIKRKTWKVVIDRDGDEVQIEPHHIIVATGVLGSPNMPQLLNHETFSGKILHQTEYPGGPSFKGKHVVVVGAGNSAVDICQDLHHHQAKSVTIVQRSSSCVADGDNAVKYMSKAWPPGVPVEIGDFKFASLPLGLLKKMSQGIQDLMWDEEKVLHGKLRKGGIELNMGPDNSGQFMMVWERCGGYWLDKGAADLIGSGEIKVKQGSQPSAFSQNELVFEDGSKLGADVVIFATGYNNIREDTRRVFGSEVIDKTSDVWGLDEEGELKGSYRPTGHPGLWFACGDFYASRYMSKHLAIQIKALELGLIPATEEGTL